MAVFDFRETFQIFHGNTEILEWHDGSYKVWEKPPDFPFTTWLCGDSFENNRLLTQQANTDIFTSVNNDISFGKIYLSCSDATLFGSSYRQFAYAPGTVPSPNQEILSKFRLRKTDVPAVNGISFLLRADFDTSTRTGQGYKLDFITQASDNANVSIRISKWAGLPNEADTSITTGGQLSNVPNILDEWIWARFKSENDTISAKWWSENESEPEDWMIEEIDYTWPITNRPGFVVLPQACEIDLDIFIANSDASNTHISLPIQDNFLSLDGSWENMITLDGTMETFLTG